MFEKLTELMDSFLDMEIPWYDCIIYKDGKEIFRHMNGYSDRENKIPVTGKEKFNIYSCSKPITCAAALQLYEKGLFKLEDKLCDYMPEFTHMKVQCENGVKDAENPITIEHLFTMTAGLSYNLSEYIKQAQKETGGRCPTRETMKYIAKEPLRFEPGTSWNYSFCHDVLAALVEVISGMKFEKYVKENIFIPLGMTNSEFCPTEKDLMELVPQYKGNGEGNSGVFLQPRIPDPNPYRLGSEYASGGAGCISTTEDYIKFCEGMINYKVLKKETIELMKTDRLTKEQHAAFWLPEGVSYGLGVRCAQKGCDDVPSDFGWSGAAGAYQVMDTENNFTMFYVQHVLHAPNQNSRSAVRRVAYEELFG